jgi:hypothetical protein
LANTRSIAMTSGRWVSIQWSMASLIASNRRCHSSWAGVDDHHSAALATLDTQRGGVLPIRCSDR